MTDIGAENSGSARPADDGLLAGIAHDTSESLELLRSLVALLLAKEAGHDGPRLEDLIGALVAQQREMLAVLRALQGEVSAIARRLLDDADQDDLNGRHATPRPC